MVPVMIVGLTETEALYLKALVKLDKLNVRNLAEKDKGLATAYMTESLNRLMERLTPEETELA